MCQAVVKIHELVLGQRTNVVAERSCHESAIWRIHRRMESDYVGVSCLLTLNARLRGFVVFEQLFPRMYPFGVGLRKRNVCSERRSNRGILFIR